MPEPLLTAAMIVRDEAPHLPACLESIRDVVDEIVIVDTGSTDATVSIARSFGADVHRHPWRGSFAEPRNIGLDLARGRWILYIDADERLRPISRELVRSTLERAINKAALRVRLVPFAGATPYWEFRLWRSDPRVRFVGSMHEKVTPSIRDVAIADRLTIGETQLCLDHVGYDRDQMRKHERNLPLLRAQLAADPINSYDWTHLARVLAGLGRSAESEAALDRAVQIARESGVSVDALAFVELIRSRRDQGQDVSDQLDEALAIFPDNVGLAWEKAQAEIDAGRYEEALRWLERFDADTEMPIEDTIAYPAELFGARAAEARALCQFRLGRYREAAAAYRQAERFEPDVQPHRLKRVLAEHRAAQEADGAHKAEPARTDEGVRWAARELLSGLAVDLGGVSLRLSATDAVRAEAVHAVLGRLAPSDRDPDVCLAFGSHRVPLPMRGPDERQGDLQLWHDDDELTVAGGTGVSARVASGRGELGGYTTQLAQAFHAVAPFMLASLLAPHERFLLHGGAIQRDGRAVLVLGDSGAGKSTLILGALNDGWGVLSDDLVLVRSDASGPVVSGIPKPLVVPAEVAGAELSSPGLRKDPRERRRIPFEAFDRAWHPVRAVVVVAHGTSDHTEVESLERPWLLGLLIASMLCRQSAGVGRYVRLALNLCGLPACRLLHSRAPENRAQSAVNAMTAHLPLV